MKKKILITSVVTIILCLCLIAGSTFALFTSQTSASIVVQSATVNVSASISNLQAFSLTDANQKKDASGNWIFDKCTDKDADGNILFVNGGTVGLSGNKLTLDKMTPGDKVTFTINVANSSNIETKCKVTTSYSSTSTPSLGNALDVSYSATGLPMDGSWVTLNPGQGGTIDVTVELPVATGNEYQNKNVTVTILVEAIQGNG